jgi:hypothetical protein
MPLALDDPRWKELRSSYGGAEDTVAWLRIAEEQGGFGDEKLGDLINEVQHQGGTSTAMNAVAGHLLSIAQRSAPVAALELLTHAGLIYASGNRVDAVPCPSFLEQEFKSSAAVGARLLAPLLPLAEDFAPYKWAVAGLAGFMGLSRFADFLDGLEFYEGRFYHDLLDGPFPEE